MADGKPRRGRPAGGKPVLTGERIVAEALVMVEQEGLDAVTMRGLARRLGVDAMSLYHHIDNRETLLNRIAELVLAGIDLPPATGVFRDDVHAMAQAFRRVALRHPHCAPLVLTRQLGSFAALAPVEAVLSILRDAGFPPGSAVHATRSVLAFVIGSLLREVSAGPTFSGDDLGGVERRLAELRASSLPHVVEAAPDLAVCEHEAEFEFGLDLLIVALERQLQRR
ncbi:TetR/AcrR family transcriptional regulator C-terminal domain-containing protein [Amycolatopsis saalfeldensis]|uniref:Regulatory protein, tetR family n=1 Tax=Amycolatopsis saalfeldensis TaxID=394193 RepID=A0A1H8YKX0_9PSEU|nr:TetR/AcrR family transcriptional regulator C-terminal domain-containing protein [Amycolatopsis saalfeldensis]SEP52800.1 regulatory protein, tetR family [Amycolatopsis saalfeldensis]